MVIPPSRLRRAREQAIPEPISQPKYPHPKILLIDMEEETASVLKADGYKVNCGSFGVPYKVPKDDNLLPVIINRRLPHDFTEQEIVVVNLIPHSLLEGYGGEKHTSKGENDW